MEMKILFKENMHNTIISSCYHPQMISSKQFAFVLKTHEQFSFLILRKLATMSLPSLHSLPEIEDFFFACLPAFFCVKLFLVQLLFDD
jgi:hypothetical protein